ncbi:GMC family oxidoreductase [Xanthobacter sp. DSM 24535]|uniref:GMC family oxidoreductase n=1 Tax=Roseixanthobacter psychrophilus TaxID=3119917 RepID=UPI0037268583
MAFSAQDAEAAEFTRRVRVNQQKLSDNLKSRYDFIVCGSGSSGSVVAGRLAEDPEVSVLLIEAGGSDDVPNVMEVSQWQSNLGSERDWDFRARPNPNLNNRILRMSMGKVLGGGSSINVTYWVHGHKNDWDFFASEAGDEAWNYESVMKIYRRIEDWQGKPDPKYRGTGGPLHVEPTRSTPLALAVSEGARSVGIPSFENLNGRMMEGDGGWSQVEVRQHQGKRFSVFRSYTFPYMDRPNLTVLTQALVTRLVFEGKRVTGVEISYDGKVHRISAGREVVLSMGAINTPKVLMQSGIGHEDELRRLGIPVVQHLPGVGKNFQDHFLLFGCVWEHEPNEAAPRDGSSCILWKSDPKLDTPDMQCVHLEGAYASPELESFNAPKNAWTFVPGVIRPKSRGKLHLTGPDPRDAVEIDANYLADPDDLKAFLRSIELCREIAHSSALRPFVTREVIPGDLKGPDLEKLARNSIHTYWHQTCTAKMGRDAMSVVDNTLRVYGIENLRIADGSIMPRVTTGNTMAPCVVIGERAAQMLKTAHQM